MFMEQFKRVQVVVLPIRELSNISLSNKHNTLVYNNDKHDTLSMFTNQHLYIISDDEIKEGDWHLNADKNVVTNTIRYTLYKATKIKLDFIKKLQEKGSDCKFYKIIATTDTSLINRRQMTFMDEATEWIYDLPQPSQQFIEKYIEEYNKGNIITDVLVEYETLKTTANNKHFGEGHIYSITNKLKINPKDNTITIKKLKDSWNKEEIIKLIKSFANNYQYASNDIGYNKWIEENL